MNWNMTRPTITDKEMRNLILKARTFGLDRNLKFLRLLNFLKINPRDIQILSLVTEMLEAAEAAALIDPLYPTSPKYENVDGHIIIGQTTNNTFFGLTPDELNRHLLIVGSSGSGKSATMKLIASQIIKGRAT